MVSDRAVSKAISLHAQRQKIFKKVDRRCSRRVLGLSVKNGVQSALSFWLSEERSEGGGHRFLPRELQSCENFASRPSLVLSQLRLCRRLPTPPSSFMLPYLAHFKSSAALPPSGAFKWGVRGGSVGDPEFRGEVGVWPFGRLPLHPPHANRFVHNASC